MNGDRGSFGGNAKSDHYRIQVDGYDSGDQVLQGGNVQIKREQ
jgi:hypothetical protein